MRKIDVSEFLEQAERILATLPEDGLFLMRGGRSIAHIRPTGPMAWAIGVVDGPIATDPDDDLFSTGARWNAEFGILTDDDAVRFKL